MSGLTQKQKRGIVALLSSLTIAEAARAASVSERSFTRWLGDPVFLRELEQQEAVAIQTVARGLVVLSENAVGTICFLLKDEDVSPAIRLRAAESVLSNLLRLRDIVSLEQRISELEAIQDKKDG